MEDTQQLLHLVLARPHHIREVGTGEAGAEYPTVVKVELLLYIIGYNRSCRGGEGQHGNVGQGVPYLGYFQVGRAEVISPLRDAVGLVDHD